MKLMELTREEIWNGNEVNFWQRVGNLEIFFVKWQSFYCHLQKNKKNKINHFKSYSNAKIIFNCNVFFFKNIF